MDQNLAFRTNSKLEKLIGRELITNNTIAFFELIKNSYDAASKIVNVKFENILEYKIESTNTREKFIINGSVVSPDTILTSKDTKIIISDRGHGMSFDEVNKYWMEIGVVHKEIVKEITVQSLSIDKMYKRVLNGEKGIGRFSSDKLGAHLKLISVDRTGREKTVVDFDWDKFNDHSRLLQEVEHEYTTKKLLDQEDSGVTLEITKLRDEWSIRDVENLKKQLKKFVSPFSQEQDDFTIIFSINDRKEKIINDAFDYSLTYITAELNDNGELNYKISDNNHQNEEIIDLLPPIFGPLKLKIIYMDSASKRAFTRRTGLSTRQYGNIKVFRDNFRIFPYGEPENDWLNIDNKHAQAVFRSLGTRDIIGYVQISNLENKGLRDATDRLGLVEDTPEFIELKNFIWKIIDILQNYIFNKLKNEAEQSGKLIEFRVESRKKEEEIFKNEVIDVINNTNLPKKEAERIISLIEHNSKQLKKDLDEVTKANNELSKKMKVFQRISGTEGILYELLHTVKNKTSILDSKLNKLIIQAKNSRIEIEDGMIRDIIKSINKLIDSALRKASASRFTKKVEIISDILQESLEDNKSLCDNKNIRITSIFRDEYKRVLCNKESIKIVFDNLFSNSIKALKDISHPHITVTTVANDNNIEIFFSDNGNGISEEDAPFIFNVSFTTTKGNGIGLANSLDIIQDHGGDMHYISSSVEGTSTTFLITLPVKA